MHSKQYASMSSLHDYTECRPELSEQQGHETNTMDASAGARVHVSAWRTSASAWTHQEGKDFSFIIYLNSFALWCIVEKKKKFSGLKGLIGVRAEGVRGAVAPPNFGQLRIFWAARENLGKASF